ncbi:hypothetical protein ABIA32_000212 [Streptacidiphilus sp. MAP12-20]|uniref:hypothetical protein n=1 Tax=Streptacidiphilus sp. MAP12-20 TaxID=3156299 RepID=UPI0035111607
MQRTTTELEDAGQGAITPPDRRVPARPVFVDASGRRQRRVRRLGRVLVVPAVAYVALLISTLLGGPTINSPYLPLPAAPQPSHAPVAAPTGKAGPGKGTHAGPGHTGIGTAGTTAGTGTGTGTQPTPGTSAVSTAPGPSGAPSAVITHGHSTHTAPPPGSTHVHPTKKA